MLNRFLLTIYSLTMYSWEHYFIHSIHFESCFTVNFKEQCIFLKHKINVFVFCILLVKKTYIPPCSIMRSLEIQDSMFQLVFDTFHLLYQFLSVSLSFSSLEWFMLIITMLWCIDIVIPTECYTNYHPHSNVCISFHNQQERGILSLKVTYIYTYT